MSLPNWIRLCRSTMIQLAFVEKPKLIQIARIGAVRSGSSSGAGDAGLDRRFVLIHGRIGAGEEVLH